MSERRKRFDLPTTRDSTPSLLVPVELLARLVFKVYLLDLGSERRIARNREENVMNEGDAPPGRIEVGRRRAI